VTERGGAAPTEDDLIARAREAFRARFGLEAGFIAVAPGRVNLIGDHVDYAGGLVLPMAIDRWTVAAGAWSPEARRSRLVALDVGESAELDLNGAIGGSARTVLGAAVGHWSGYIAGVVSELMTEAGRRRAVRAVDLLVTSSVPRASGLSSSAALELAVGTLLNHAWGLALTHPGLALACRRAEHLGGGVRCGVMDQFASALGVADHALRIDCRDLAVAPVPVSPALRVLVVDTRTPRSLSAGKYDGLVARLDRARAALGVESLRAVDRADLDGRGLDPDARASAEHFLDECALVDDAAGALGSGDAPALACAFAASHASLRERLGVSCPELDAAVAAASGCGPDIAARLTGAGMGGCAVIVCPADRSAAVADAVECSFARSFSRACEVLPVSAAGGARVVA
jgi:galactokinase